MRALFISVLIALHTLVALSSPAHAQRIVIDPGHGGNDPGGVGTGLQEKNIVLDVGMRFKALLDADTADTAGGGKWTALMTRSTDVFVSLAGRSQYSNNQNADRFMSIHSNAFSNTAANGTETFSFAEGTVGAQLRSLVQAEMITAWKLTNRGNKTANFAVLRDTAAPAELHELAFITNATDAAKLGSATERQKAAVAHLRAIQRHYNITPYVPGNTTPPPEETDGEVAGHVVNDLGPVAGATLTLDGGATVTTDDEGGFLFAKVAAGERVITASAEGHVTRMVDVAVAASARAEIELELVRHGGPGDDGDDGQSDDGMSGGCAATSGAGPLLLLALLAFRRRRG
jgi:N-acetylmuramoyl-L-alanine amidase